MWGLTSILNSAGHESLGDLERRAVELTAVKARYERIFRGATAYGFLDWDVKKSKIHWSGGYWAYLGYEDLDMNSNPLTTLEYIHKDDVERITGIFSDILKGNDENEIIYRIRNKSGNYIWTEVRVEIERDHKGYVNYISGVALDISQLKHAEQALVESENRYSRIIQSSSDGVWEWTAQGDEFYFSDKCWRNLGYREENIDELIKGDNKIKVWREHIHPDCLANFDNAMLSHIEHKTPYDIEYRIEGSDGEWQWIRTRGQMSYDNDGQPFRMSGTNMNITSLKKAEESVLRAKEEAERANKAKSDFLSSMSHELRTPLNAILAYSQLIEMDTNLGEEQRENNIEIKKAGLHLKQLVGDVLDLAKIEAGGVKLSFEEINLFRLVQECLLLVKTDVQEKKIKVVVDSNKNSETKVVGSPVHLRQVVLNLLSNAVKYNNREGCIYIFISKTEENLLKLSVRDTGKGVPKASQHELFQPFNRLGVESAQIEGSGVGLVITQKLVEKMAGTIGFESEEGIGSTFWIEMPLFLEEEEKIPGESESAKSRAEAFSGFSFSACKKILYVEDNQSNQRVMTQIAARYKELQLIVEPDALRGMYSARADMPDLIILDINLPGVNGYELLKLLKQDTNTAHIPIVALSANAMSHDIQKGLELGFCAYLTKPIDVNELISTLNNLLSD